MFSFFQFIVVVGIIAILISHLYLHLSYAQIKADIQLEFAKLRGKL